MRDRMERLVLLPFTVGCVSEASVAVGVLHPRRSKSEPNINSPPIRNKEEQEEDEYEDEEGSLSDGSVKGSYRFLQATPKPNVSTGFHRLFKTFSQLFVDKEEMEEVERNMEIGSPTDVKHVTHIGWDVSETTNPVKGFDNLIASDLLSLPSTSFNQFDLSVPNASS